MLIMAPILIKPLEQIEKSTSLKQHKLGHKKY